MEKSKTITITKRDFRSLGNDTQAELRRLAILQIDKGIDKETVAEMMEVNVQTVSGWVRKKVHLESRNYQGELRGRKEGEKRILNTEQETSLKTLILEKTPEKLDLGCALWTRRVVKELIKIETSKEFPINTVSNYLNRWGLTPQRPGKIAHEQDDLKIQNWIKNDYPLIETQARLENAVIKWSDESGISLNTYYGKSYALKGKTPHIKLPATRTHISMISSISVGGTSEFMLYKKGLDSQTFINFLGRQIQDSKQKIFLIVDNLRVHKSKEVMAWVKRHSKQIAIFFPATLRSSIQPRGIFEQYLKTQVT
jgi:transposase